MTTVLVIGGLDPCGGAGIGADARMAWAHAVHPRTVATCLTVQNRDGFRSLHPTELGLLRESLEVAIADGPVHAVKIGLCGSAAVLDLVVHTCAELLGSVPVVVDPVLMATSGGLRCGDELVASYLAAAPQTTLLTPNLPELERLAPGGVEDLLRRGCAHVLIKGGHAEDPTGGGGTAGETVEDRLVNDRGTLRLRHPRLACGPVHGTGCALATAAAARLAQGAEVEAACRGAVADVAESLRRTRPSADGRPVPLAISAARSPG